MAEIKVQRLGVNDSVAVDFTRSNVRAFEVAGTDLVIKLRDGRTVVIQDFAMQSMISATKLQFSDGQSLSGRQVMAEVQSISVTEKSVQVVTPELITPGGSPQTEVPTTGRRKAVAEGDNEGSRISEPVMEAAKAAEPPPTQKPTASDLQQVIAADASPTPSRPVPVAPPAPPVVKVSDVSERSLFIPPSSPTINQIAGNDIVGISEAQAGVVVSGGGSSNADVTLRLQGLQGSMTRTVRVVDGKWSLTLSASDVAALGDGMLAVTASQAFSTGVASATSGRLVLIDLTAPNAPVMSPFGNQDKVGHAEIGQANLLRGTSGETSGSVRLTLTGANGQVVQKTAVIGPDGAWSTGLSSAEAALLGQGTVAVVAQVVDRAGNTSPVVPKDFLIDTVAAPAAPGIDAVSTDDVVGMADFANGATLAVSGTAPETSGTISLRIVNDSTGQSITLQGVAVDAQGHWQTMLTRAQLELQLGGEGTLRVEATHLDVAGNPSAVATRDVSVDLVVQPATLTSVGGKATTASGEFGIGEPMTSNPGIGVPFVGSVEPGATSVTVRIISGLYTVDKVLVAGVDFDAVTGAYSFQLSQAELLSLDTTYDPLVGATRSREETLRVQVTTTDRAGNVGTTEFDGYLDRVPPGQPTLNALGGVLADGKLNIADAAAGVVFTGQGEALSTVRLNFYKSGQSTPLDFGAAGIPAIQVGQNGLWSIQLTADQAAALGQGALTVRAQAVDRADNRSAESTFTGNFGVDTIAPELELDRGPGRDLNDAFFNIAEAANGLQLDVSVADGTDMVTSVAVKIYQLDASGNRIGTPLELLTNTTNGAWSGTISTEALVNKFGPTAKLLLTMKATDAFNNVGPEFEHAFTLDQARPDTTLDLGDQPSSTGWVNIAQLAAAGVDGDGDGQPDGHQITGHSEPGASITLTWARGPNGGAPISPNAVLPESFVATAGADGRWSITLSKEQLEAFGPGELIWTATAEDQAGNTEAQPATGYLTIDLQRPIVPELDNGDELYINREQAENGVVVSGSKSTDARVKIYVQFGNGEPTAITESLGTLGQANWSVTLGLDVLGGFSGTNAKLLIYSVDRAGNESAQAREIPIIIDTLLPVVTVNPVHDDNWVGLAQRMSIDGVTVSGTVSEELGSMTVTFTNLTTSATYSRSVVPVLVNGVWSWSVPLDGPGTLQALGHGVIEVKTVAVDLANNSHTQTTTFNNDFQPPSNATFDSGLDVWVGEAQVDGAGTQLRGTAEAGTTIRFYVDGQEIVSAQQLVGANGSWSADLAGSVLAAWAAEGERVEKTVQVQLTDAAGNVSGFTPIQILVDRDAPPAPEILHLAGDGRVGLAEGGAGKSFTISGKAEYAAFAGQGSHVKISLRNGAANLDQESVWVPVSSNGDWTVTVSHAQLAALLLPGQTVADLTVTAVARDAAGNVTPLGDAASAPLLVDLDPPGVLAGGILRVDAAGEEVADLNRVVPGTGANAGALLFNAADVGADGQVYVKIKLDESASSVSVVLGDGTPGNSTTYSATLIPGSDGKYWLVALTQAGFAKVGEGAAQLTVTAVDLAGNPATATQALVVDTVPPAQPSITANPDWSDGINGPEAGLGTDATGMLLQGTAPIGQGFNTVVVHLKGSVPGPDGQIYEYVSGPIAVTGAGVWQITVPSSEMAKIGQGPNGGTQLSMWAVAYDPAGNPSASSAVLVRPMDTVGPTAPPTIEIGDMTADNVVNIAEHAAGNIVIQGGSNPENNLFIEIRNADNQQVLGTAPTTRDASGHWTMVWGPGVPGWSALATGSYQVRVMEVDSGGNVSTAATQDFAIDRTPPTFTLNDAGVISDSVVANAVNGEITLSGTLSENIAAGSFRIKLTGSNGTSIVLEPTLGAGKVWHANVAATTLTGLGEGLVTVAADLLVDSAGNPGSAGGTPQIRVDTLAPGEGNLADPTLNNPNAWVNQSHVAGGGYTLTGTLPSETDATKQPRMALALKGAGAFVANIAEAAVSWAFVGGVWTWSANVSGATLASLADGVVSIVSVTTFDAYGNSTVLTGNGGTAFLNNAFRLDKTSPVVDSASITLIDNSTETALLSGADTVISGPDLLDGFRFRGSAPEAGLQVKIRVENSGDSSQFKEWTLTAGAAGNWTSPVIAAGDLASQLGGSGLADGQKKLIVTYTDAAGNVSAPAEKLFTLDTTGPVVENFSLPASFGGGGLNLGELNQGFALTGEVGSDVAEMRLTFRSGGADVIAVTLPAASLSPGSGGKKVWNWSASQEVLAALIAKGDDAQYGVDMRLLVTAYDAHGNAFTRTVDLNKVDTAMPADPQLGSITGLSSGYVNAASGANITIKPGISTPEIGGKATVKLVNAVGVEMVHAVEATPNASGQFSGFAGWTFTKANILSTLGQGVIRIVVTVTDAMGNATVKEVSTFNVDTLPPAGSAVLDALTEVNNAQGLVTAAGYYNVASVNGSRELTVGSVPGDAVAVKLKFYVDAVGGTLAHTVNASLVNGQWKYVPGGASAWAALGSGSYKVVTEVTDAAGNTTTQAVNAGTNFKLDKEPPTAIAPSASPVGDGVLSSVDVDANWSFTNSSGEARTVKVVFTNAGNGNATVTKEISFSGNGTLNFSLNAGEVATLGQGGNISYVVTTRDASGNAVSSIAQIFTIDTVAPVRTATADQGVVFSKDYLMELDGVIASDASAVRYELVGFSGAVGGLRVATASTPGSLVNAAGTQNTAAMSVGQSFTAADLAAGRVFVYSNATPPAQFTQSKVTVTLRVFDANGNSSDQTYTLWYAGNATTSGGILDMADLHTSAVKDFQNELRISMSPDGPTAAVRLKGYDANIGNATIDDLLIGGSGDDTFVGGRGIDWIRGAAHSKVQGAGRDTWIAADDSEQGVRIALDVDNLVHTYLKIENDGFGNADYLFSIDNLIGSAGNDVLIGYGADGGKQSSSDLGNVIDGGAGIDVLNGRGGVNDTYVVGSGTVGARVDLTAAVQTGTVNSTNLTGGNYVQVQDSWGHTDYIAAFENFRGGAGGDRFKMSLAQLTQSTEVSGAAGTDRLTVETGASGTVALGLPTGVAGKVTGIEELYLTSSSAVAANFTTTEGALGKLFEGTGNNAVASDTITIRLDQGDTLTIGATAYNADTTVNNFGGVAGRKLVIDVGDSWTWNT